MVRGKEDFINFLKSVISSNPNGNIKCDILYIEVLLDIRDALIALKETIEDKIR